MKKNIKNPKGKKNNKDNRNIFIIVGCLLIIIFVIVMCYNNNSSNTDPNNKKDTNTFAKEVRVLKSTNVKTSLIDKDAILITNYEEYKQYYNDEKNNVLPSMFDSINFILARVSYDSCSENNIVISDVEFNNNDVIVTLYYDASCGVCAPLYNYYLIEVPKNIDNPTVKFNSIPRNNPDCDPNVVYKPIIYIYPEEEMNVSIKLLNSENISVSYPKYDNGWDVIVDKNGNIYHPKTNRNYYGLYWEGNKYITNMTDEGYVVKGEETYKFLENKLEVLGLNEREINEFIIYWLPKLESNKYNYIRFEKNDSIDEYMKLDINPKPDTLIRVYMVYKPLNDFIQVTPQHLEKNERKGYSVIEWGGSKIN